MTSGCSDDENDDFKNLPTASIQNVTANIDGIEGLVDHVYLTVDNSGKNVLAKTEFKNNSFSFTFPQTVDQELLYSISSDQTFKNFTISDKNANICFGEYYAYKNDKAVGYFDYTDKAAFGAKSSYLIYTDRDVTVSGRVNNGSQTFIIANCSFIKGWNLVTNNTESSQSEHIERWETVAYNNFKWIYNSFK